MRLFRISQVLSSLTAPGQRGGKPGQTLQSGQARATFATLRITYCEYRDGDVNVDRGELTR